MEENETNRRETNFRESCFDNSQAGGSVSGEHRDRSRAGETRDYRNCPDFKLHSYLTFFGLSVSQGVSVRLANDKVPAVATLHSDDAGLSPRG